MQRKRLIIVATRILGTGFDDARRVDTDITTNQATVLERAFLADTLHTASNQSLHADIRLAENDTANTSAHIGNIPIVAQKGATSAERLKHLFAQGFADGYSAICIVGSNTPHLPIAFLTEAFGYLDPLQKTPIVSRETFSSDFTGLPVLPDLVLGQSFDNNCYLLGLRAMPPALFDTIDWESDAVFEAIRTAAAQNRLKTMLLPQWYSINTSTDRKRLSHDFERGIVQAAYTKEAIQQIHKDKNR